MVKVREAVDVWVRVLVRVGVAVRVPVLVLVPVWVPVLVRVGVAVRVGVLVLVPVWVTVLVLEETQAMPSNVGTLRFTLSQVPSMPAKLSSKPGMDIPGMEFCPQQ